MLRSFVRLLAAALALQLVSPGVATARTWTDATGKFTLDADLIARGAHHVVLQRKDGSLASVAVSELSAADQKFLDSREADAAAGAAAKKGMHVWTFQSGLQATASVVGYGRRQLVFARRNRKLFVNDRPYENLPEIYQRMLPRIIGYLVDLPKLTTPEQLMSWSIGLDYPRRFTVDGVMLELENGDRYGVPFFLFSDADQKILKEGWDRWLAAKEDSADREQEDLAVEARSQYQDAQNRQVTQLQLALLATAAGVVEMWEVALYPGSGMNAAPRSVIVPARDSRSATEMALSRNPGFVAGPVRRL